MLIFFYVLLGLAAGVLSGLVGIGGGILMVPGLIFIFGMTQHQAQGTTLAMMVPPIGILAAWTYYRAGHVDLKVAGLLCAGFLIGGLVGARAAVSLSNPVLEKVFGAVLLVIALKMLLSK
ncbi:MAG TPA: sulfite exporter TauE/SafE family protein [Thermodesulfobacteriota bacterium]|nr:sulfite exporter TauE/SafE family protein [Thermodesulfobacteriota bacterium]